MTKRCFFVLLASTALSACGGGSSSISNDPNLTTTAPPEMFVSRDGKRQQLVGNTSNNGYGVPIEKFIIVDQINGFEILHSLESQNRYIRKIGDQEILLGLDPIHNDVSYTGLPTGFATISQASGVYVMRGAGMIDDNGLGVTRDGGSELTLFLNKGAEAATYYQTIKAGEYFPLSEGLVYSNGNLIGQGSVVRGYEEKGEGCCVPDIVVEESTPGPFSGNISGTSLGNSKLIRTGKAGEGRYIITYTGSGLSPVPEVRN